MRKKEIPEIMRPQYDAYKSENGIDYEPRKVSIFDVVHICDYYYRDFGHAEKRNVPKPEGRVLTPVFFHHNDYWIIDGFDLARVITQMSHIHRSDWRKVVSGKWRLQPDWHTEWYRVHKTLKTEDKPDEE
jgi:hypothetical protein